jgi:hypothetical protein
MIAIHLATAGLLGMIAVTALAQAPPMDPAAGGQSGHVDRDSLPRSNQASNIGPADTNGTIAPTLPSPGLGLDATTRQYLHAAREALAAGRTGEAQQALEMAETRLLGRSVPPARADIPSGQPKAIEIHDALHALGDGDRTRAISIIDIAINN